MQIVWSVRRNISEVIFKNKARFTCIITSPFAKREKVTGLINIYAM